MNKKTGINLKMYIKCIVLAICMCIAFTRQTQASAKNVSGADTARRVISTSTNGKTMMMIATNNEVYKGHDAYLYVFKSDKKIRTTNLTKLVKKHAKDYKGHGDYADAASIRCIDNVFYIMGNYTTKNEKYGFLGQRSYLLSTKDGKKFQYHELNACESNNSLSLKKNGKWYLFEACVDDSDTGVGLYVSKDLKNWKVFVMDKAGKESVKDVAKKAPISIIDKSGKQSGLQYNGYMNGYYYIESSFSPKGAGKALYRTKDFSDFEKVSKIKSADSEYDSAVTPFGYINVSGKGKDVEMDTSNGEKESHPTYSYQIYNKNLKLVKTFNNILGYSYSSNGLCLFKKDSVICTKDGKNFKIAKNTIASLINKSNNYFNSSNCVSTKNYCIYFGKNDKNKKFELYFLNPSTGKHTVYKTPIDISGEYQVNYNSDGNDGIYLFSEYGSKRIFQHITLT